MKKKYKKILLAGSGTEIEPMLLSINHLFFKIDK
jgi:hypothetical protein|tara:strand:- start:107 stop:208 length:102 start_codon:yes stop_codon:yes gene_type:complete